MDFKKILKDLNSWKKKDERMQKALKEYTNIIAGNSQTPAITDTCVEAYLSAFHYNEHLHEMLEYYLYEGGIVSVRQKNGKKKEYDFEKDEDVIKFLDQTFNKKSTNQNK